MEDELQLVKRAKAGDTDAFEQLVIMNQKRVYNIALRMTGNAEDAEDLTQEAFLKAFRALPSFKMESSFSTWLYRLTSNVCIDFLRRSHKNKMVSLFKTNQDGEEEALEIEDKRNLPEDEAEKKELHSEIYLNIIKLTPDLRQALVLREIGGLSYEEISKSLDLPEGTVKSRISRARLRMRSLLSGMGNIFESDPSNSLGKE